MSKPKAPRAAADWLNARGMRSRVCFVCSLPPEVLREVDALGAMRGIGVTVIAEYLRDECGIADVPLISVKNHLYMRQAHAERRSEAEKRR